MPALGSNEGFSACAGGGVLSGVAGVDDPAGEETDVSDPAREEASVSDPAGEEARTGPRRS